MNLSQSQLHAISRALSVAADVYDADAKALLAEQPRLSEQFVRQAHEARALADQIDDEG